MEIPTRPVVSSSDLSGIIHPPGLRVFGSGVIDRGKRIGAEHKTMPFVFRIPVIPCDITIAIDAPRHGFLRPGEVNGCEDSVAQQEPVVVMLTEQIVMAHDITVAIDPNGAG